MHKEVMKTAEKLTKKGLLTLKPTSYGIHVSLNPHRITRNRTENKRPVKRLTPRVTLKCNLIVTRTATDKKLLSLLI
jgi:hypothetical protein